MSITRTRFCLVLVVTTACVCLWEVGIGHAETPLAPGRKALLFQVSSDIRLSSFKGGTISWKHHTSAGGAWRMGFTASASTSDDETDRVIEFDSTEAISLRSSNADFMAVSVAIDRLHYAKPDSRVTVYYGLGPVFDISRRSTDGSEIVGSTTYRSVSETSEIGFGLGVAIGVECFPHSQVGILGEYASSLAYRWSKSESTYRSSSPTRIDTRESNRVELRSDAVRLGVSIYW